LIGPRHATAPADRAEVALRASNVKSRWIDEFRGAAEAGRRTAALRSVHFTEMIERYVRAFGADLNAYYPGVNALGLLQAQVALAGAAGRLVADFRQRCSGSRPRVRKLLCSRTSATLALALKMDDTMRALDDGPDDPGRVAAGRHVAPDDHEPRAARGPGIREALINADWFSLDAVRRNNRLLGAGPVRAQRLGGVEGRG
jgi:hypothetical protein